jgi:Leucine-rich repeat (LRR) protein
VFSVSSLSYLDISGHEELGPLPTHAFHNYSLPLLRTLCLNNTGVYSLHMTVFKRALRALTKLDLAVNQLSHLFYTDRMPSLEVLGLSRNGLFTFPRTCASKYI